jgi:hypothetical protein
MGHSNPILINGKPMPSVVRLQPGDRIEPTLGLVLEFVLLEDG